MGGKRSTLALVGLFVVWATLSATRLSAETTGNLADVPNGTSSALAVAAGMRRPDSTHNPSTNLSPRSVLRGEESDSSGPATSPIAEALKISNAAGAARFVVLDPGTTPRTQPASQSGDQPR